MNDDAPAAGLDPARVQQRKREIVDAAIKCLRRYGAKKVGAEDIAQAAGISRRTLYRFFAGRRQIMQAVLLRRLEAIADGVKAALRLCDGFEESLIVGTLETMRLARADRIYDTLVEDDRTLTLDDDPLDPDAPIRRLTESIWADVFAGARAQGMLRDTVDNAEALSWLIDVHELFDVRRDLSDEEVEDALRKFVLPSLIPDHRLSRNPTTPPAPRKASRRRSTSGNGGRRP
jgi:AcrR family transcriptional regulator